MTAIPKSGTIVRPGASIIQYAPYRYRAFSLIELVIVILIMATISAIAIPRIVRAAEGADMAALRADFDELNKAVELYHVEHDAYPSEAAIAHQLTKYTDRSGNVNDVFDEPGGFIYGPYLHKIPPLPVGPNEGLTKIASAKGATVGWIYKIQKKIVYPNLYDADGNVPADLEGRIGGLVQQDGDEIPLDL